MQHASAADRAAFHASPNPERRTRSRAETVRAMVGDPQPGPAIPFSLAAIYAGAAAYVADAKREGAAR